MPAKDSSVLDNPAFVEEICDRLAGGEGLKDRKRIVQLLREWIRNDVLRVVEDEDEKRNTRKFVVVGKWVA